MNIFKVFVIAMLFTTSLLVANPSGGNVVNGSATINSAGNVLTVNQTTDRAVINWNDFSIAFGETTNFNLPNASSTILNRVVGIMPTNISGILNSNGNIILINENGILISKTGVINVNSLIGSTLDVNNSEFMSGKNLNFVGDKGTITNLGTVNALGGAITLIATNVINEGILNAPEVYLRETEGYGIVRVNKRVQDIKDDLNNNNGNMYALAINKNGVKKGTTIIKKNGQTYLIDQRGGSSVYHISDPKLAEDIGFKRMGNSDNYKIGKVEEENIVIDNKIVIVEDSVIDEMPPSPVVEVKPTPESIQELSLQVDTTPTKALAIESDYDVTYPIANALKGQNSVHEYYEILRFRNKEHSFKEYFRPKPQGYGTLFRGGKSFGFNIVLMSSFSDSLEIYTGERAILDNFVSSMVY